MDRLVAVEIRKLYLLLESACKMAEFYSRFHSYNVGQARQLHTQVSEKARCFLDMSSMHEREIKSYKLNVILNCQSAAMSALACELRRLKKLQGEARRVSRYYSKINLRKLDRIVELKVDLGSYARQFLRTLGQ